MTPISQREPGLAASHSQHGHRRISLRKLATILKAAAPDAVDLEVVEAALYHQDFYVRLGAATLLGKRRDRDARLVMARALQDGDVPTRASVARQLGRFTWFASEPLLRKSLSDPDTRVREAALYALADQRDLNAYQLMAESLNGAPEMLRAAAAYALRQTEDPAAVPALAIALEALDPDTRVLALESLGYNATPQAVPIVRAALADHNADVCYAAALSFLELAGETALPELAAQISDLNQASPVREAHLRGLFHASNYLGIKLADSAAIESILNALESALSDPAAKTRMAVYWLLAGIRLPRASKLLANAYAAETDPTAKAHCLRVALSLMTPVGDAMLEDALASPEPYLAFVAKHLAQQQLARFNPEDTQRHGLATPRLDSSEI
jgi:HEAT repeat protein